MDRIDFCGVFKKSPGKHESWSIFKKKLSIPAHSIDGSFVMNILPADSGSFQV